MSSIHIAVYHMDLPNGPIENSDSCADRNSKFFSVKGISPRVFYANFEKIVEEGLTYIQYYAFDKDHLTQKLKNIKFINIERNDRLLWPDSPFSLAIHETGDLQKIVLGIAEYDHEGNLVYSKSSNEEVKNFINKRNKLRQNASIEKTIQSAFIIGHISEEELKKP